MKREEILALAKNLVLKVRDDEDRLKNDEMFRLDFAAKHELLEREIKGLSEADMKVLDKEYQKWYQKEIIPYIKK